MERHGYASAAIAAIMALPGPAALAQEGGDVQEMVRVSVAGTIVELTVEEAAEACDIDVETLRADEAALEAGAGDPVSPVEQGAVDGAAPEAGAEPGAAASAEAGAGAAVAGGDVAADGSPAGAEATDPDATTTNDVTAMAGDGADASAAPTGAGAAGAPAEAAAGGAEAGDAGGAEVAAAGSAPQVEAPDTAVVDNAELEAAADPEVPLPTAVAVCEISRERAEELDLVAPD